MCDNEQREELDEWKKKESQRIQALNEEQEDEERMLTEGE